MAVRVHCPSSDVRNCLFRVVRVQGLVLGVDRAAQCHDRELRRCSTKTSTMATETTEELKLSLPVTLGKVNAVVAKRDEWTANELNERTVQFGPVAFTYRDIISFSEVSDRCSIHDCFSQLHFHLRRACSCETQI